MKPAMSDYDRIRQIRRWRRGWHARLFFAVGVILSTYTALTLLPAVWWSDMARVYALALTLWLVWAQIVALRAVWRIFHPMWREE
jgi:hypothetical protein